MPNTLTRQVNATDPAAVELKRVNIGYGDLNVISDLNLTVRSGEIVSLLGPSGCGKTTTLRAIAGFVPTSSGSINLHGSDVTCVPPNRRNIGIVFQGYALFPHLSVFENVAYGLKIRKVPRPEIQERVSEALALVQLSAYSERKPKQLSGGQQQRVAIARAVVISPSLLLLDEPLSNLDAKLRNEMRFELKRMLDATRIASIFVTHDQEEAIVLSDRIVLMNGGRVEQEGPPSDVYERPETLFAASFFGQANFLNGVARAVSGSEYVTVTIGGQDFVGIGRGNLEPGGAIVAVVRHDRVRINANSRNAQCENRLSCFYEASDYLGRSTLVRTRHADQSVLCLISAADTDQVADEPGGTITVGWSASDMAVFPAN